MVITVEAAIAAGVPWPEHHNKALYAAIVATLLQRVSLF